MPKRVRVCTIAGCGKKHYGRGLCSMHYTRWYIHGDTSVNHNVTHGMSRSKAYSTWSGIKQRCNNPRDKDYQGYGGRGITVCKEWSESFQEFYRDMGDPPTEEHQIDRRDNNLGYCKDNCRWSTPAENSQNTRNVKLTKEDVAKIRKSSLSIKKLASMYKVSQSRISEVRNRHSWKNV